MVCISASGWIGWRSATASAEACSFARLAMPSAVTWSSRFAGALGFGGRAGLAHSIAVNSGRVTLGSPRIETFSG